MTTRTKAFLLILAAVLALSGCQKKTVLQTSDPLSNAYATEQDWSKSDHLISLNYQQAQGKRLFYDKCVWCHADSTPAGPSNRTNVAPPPPLLNDGATLNPLSDEYLQNVITLGGSAMGKSAMMPPWGETLSQTEIQSVIAFTRAIAVPPYQPPAQPSSQYSIKHIGEKKEATR
jgi:cytochrome c5